MGERSLKLVGSFLIIVGILPLLSAGIATTILFISDCSAEPGYPPSAACPYYDTATEGLLASMMLAGIYAVISIPIGLIGVLILTLMYRKNRQSSR